MDGHLDFLVAHLIAFGLLALAPQLAVRRPPILLHLRLTGSGFCIPLVAPGRVGVPVTFEKMQPPLLLHPDMSGQGLDQVAVVTDQKKGALEVAQHLLQDFLRGDV